MYLRNGRLVDGRHPKNVPEHGSPERENAWKRFKDKCPDCHPKLEYGAFQDFLYGEARQKWIDEQRSRYMAVPDHTEHELNSGYRLRIRNSGFLSFRVDLVSPEGQEIAKHVRIIRGIARKFEDPLTGWSSNVRLLTEGNIIESWTIVTHQMKI